MAHAIRPLVPTFYQGGSANINPDYLNVSNTASSLLVFFFLSLPSLATLANDFVRCLFGDLFQLDQPPTPSDICLEILPNGVRQELKFQVVLQIKSGLLPVQWQCRFRTFVGMVVVFLLKNSIHVLSVD